jgi:hypothetical protein
MRPGTTQINSPSHGLAVVSARSRLPAPAGRDSFNANPLVIAEAAGAVRDAEQLTAEIVACWPTMIPQLRPAALRQLVMALVTLFLAEPVRAEIFLRDAARAAGVPVTELRRAVQRRADIINHLPTLLERRRAETESEVVSWMML